MRSVVHTSKSVVNINLIMYNPNIYLFSWTFFSVVSGGTLHFYSVNDWQGLKFWYDYYGLRLGKPSPGQREVKALTELMKAVAEIL